MPSSSSSSSSSSIISDSSVVLDPEPAPAEGQGNVVTISGMFGSNKTYFADNPVIIDIDGLEWPAASPFTVVKVLVKYQDKVVGECRDDAGGSSRISFDISSALRAIWSDYEFGDEIAAATAAKGGSNATIEREMRSYKLEVYTEYISEDGVFTQTQYTDNEEHTEIDGGQCLIGGRTEWERSLITDTAKRDVSSLEKSNPRNGDASTKPKSSPELVGKDSITSWVDVNSEQTVSKFYAAPTGQDLPAITGDSDDFYSGNDNSDSSDEWNGHAPRVMRDAVPYVDFLFVNRRGAVETCSARMLEALSIGVEAKQYTRIGAPSYSPTRSLMTITSGGRRSWSMSSGHQTREWAEWWALEFLMSERRWMWYQPAGSETGAWVPVSVTPAKQATGIYDRVKQEMPSVEFTVTLGIEG